jgi:aminoglycoside phosphotransferase (APT) family kinase protein
MSPALVAANGPPPNLDEIVASACDQAGIVARCMRPLRHFANAVYLVEADRPVVARVAYRPGVISRAHTAVSVARWLVRQGFPATHPVELPAGRQQPIVCSSATAEIAVTFWTYYPQQRCQTAPTVEDIATIARQLHSLDAPVTPLDLYEPLRSLRRDVRDSHLDNRTRQWLDRRIEELLDAYRDLEFPLGVGLIHGDMYVGNLLCADQTGGVVLGDWDSVCIGPREIDLAPTYTSARFGLDDDTIGRFATAYGYDLRTWAGYPTLRAIRELSTLTALIRLAPTDNRAAQELHYRLRTLRDDDRAAIWKAQ